MAQQEFPNLNEVEPSWADVAIKIPLYDGPTVKTNDISDIKWSDKVDVGVSRGTSGGRKLRSTTGQYDCDASITFYKRGWKIFRTALAAKSSRISLVRFDVLIQHTPPGSSDIFTVKLLGARVIGRTAQMQEGNDPDKIEVPLFLMQVQEDGVSLL